MKRRGLTIALAVLLAILGTGGVLVYVNHANSRALAGQRAVTVLIAKSLIPAGTSAGDAQDQGLLGTEKLPAESVPTDALTAVTPDIRGLVTDSNVQPGQLLLRPLLVTSAQVTTGFTIPRGMVAVAIQFCVPEAVAGNVRPGSQVAVFATTISVNSSNSNNSNNSITSLSAQAECTGPHQVASGFTATTKLVLPKVTVLAVGPASTDGQENSQSSSSGSSQSSGSGSSGSAASSALITVAVSQHDAERLIQLTEDGLPYLALINANSGLKVTTTGASSTGH